MTSEQNLENIDRSTSPRAALPVRRLARLAWSILVLGLVVAAFYAGNRIGFGAASSATSSSTGPPSAAPVWTCSMHPEVRLPESGSCPICGMDLIAAAAAAPTASAKPLKYACAMMCIPPQEQDGKCPVCGMDMVPVEASGGGGSDNEVTLSAAALRLARVETAIVERRFANHILRLIAMVEFDETRQRSIAARVPGRLDRLYVDYTGITVAPGDHLVYVYSPELLTAQEELLQAVKGVKEGQQAGISALKEIAEENVRIVRSKMELWGLTEDQIQEIIDRGTATDHITIFAPIGGVVVKKDAVQGMYVMEGMELYTIADLSHVWLQLKAYESDLVWIRYGQPITFEAEAYPGETFSGTIAFISQLLNPRTRTIDVRANVNNPELRLKPGMFVRATVHSRLADGGRVMDPALAGKFMCPMHPEIVRDDAATDCELCGMKLVATESLGYSSADPATARAPLVIPTTAPLLTGRRAIVYVADPHNEGTFTAREVELGPRAGDVYLVSKGLTEGERVAARGALRLDSAAQILGNHTMMSPTDPSHTRREPESAPVAVTRLNPAPEFVNRLDAPFAAYFVLQDALSHDRWEEGRTAAGKLKQGVEALADLSADGEVGAAWITDFAALKKSVTKLAAAPDMKNIRIAYQPVSNIMITIAQRYGTSGRFPVRLYHCPMAFDDKGADWLQNKSGVENPYFGAEMFSCGVLKEVITEGPEEDQP